MTRSSHGHVGVFCGGNSHERDISLQTGQAVHEALLRQSVHADLVDVGQKEIVFSDYDVAFIALHGRDGEDGKFQAVLEYHDIPYTGSRVAASSLAMNKWHTKAVWKASGINTPEYWVTGAFHDLDLDEVVLPVYVKPVNEGSSIGISYATTRGELIEAISLAEKYDDTVLIEQAIEGGEYTYAYLDGFEKLPLIKLETKTEFYDYEAKYVRDDTSYIVNPDLSEQYRSDYTRLANLAFRLLGLTGWGRIDFMVDSEMQAWMIEANTVPGMTSHSLVPMAAAADGIGFDELCMRILETAYVN